MDDLTTNTTLTFSRHLSSQDNIGCVKLRDLIHHENLESMVQFNFLVDVDFLMSNVYNKNMSTIIIHGSKDLDNSRVKSRKWPNVKMTLPVIKDRFGTHHSKAMILFFRDKLDGTQSAQIVIMTANMVPDDWELMTQGVYRTPKCMLKNESHSAIPGRLTGSEYGSPFEREFIKYLQAYDLVCLSPIISRLKLFDWSHCRAILIGSVPGYHRQPTSAFSSWGLERLATVLRENVEIPTNKESQLILQCSSIAKSPEKWFKQDVCGSMSETMSKKSVPLPKVCIIYPTLQTASNSITGREESGGFLRFEKETYQQIHIWFDPYLYDWKSEKAGRQFLMPHIKSYTRIYKDNNKTMVAWHLLTSANLSRAAWGEYQKNKTQTYIKSFELGVLFCPSLFEDICPDMKLVPVTTETANHDDGDISVKVRLPFDLPLIRHPKPNQCFTRLPKF